MAERAVAASPDVAGSSEMKLVAGPAPANGTRVAGVAITMPAGSHTYWKMPGDAGVPPVFSFAGSRNLREAKVAFPPPRRITEAGLEAFGYLDHVVLPVDVTPADPAQPVDLHVDVAYAVCNTICIPAHGAASVVLPPGMAGPDAAVVAAAQAAVPVPASLAERAELALMPDAGAAKPTWSLTWTGDKAPDDIFADAPDGYYFATRKTGPGTWRLVADQVPATGAWPVAVALTLARAAHSLVVTEKLDSESATR